MEKLTRKERRWLEREEIIIEAAEEIISEKGFDKTTMDDIAIRAEVGKGTLYLHFNSKTSIYLNICLKGSELLNEKMKNVLLKEKKGIRLIEELGHTYLDFIRENPIYFYAFHFYENVVGNDEFADSKAAQKCEEYAKEAMTYIVRALQIGMQDGTVKPEFDPKELGVIMWGASKGIVHLAFLKQQSNHMKVLDEVEFSLQSIITSFINVISNGIKND